jgi:hypothetical protein
MSQGNQSECCLCGGDEELVLPFNGGTICKSCLDRFRNGRDDTTKAARAMKVALTEQGTANQCVFAGENAAAESHQAGANEYGDKAIMLFGRELMAEEIHGEFVRKGNKGFARKLQSVREDASAHRLELLGRLGNECLAMGLDAAETAGASNSLEKMLAHQLAVTHKIALQLTDKAMFEPNPKEQTRLLNLSARMMDTYQRGLLTLQRIQTKGNQQITVQHINITDGGQAVIGSVKTGGAAK